MRMNMKISWMIAGLLLVTAVLAAGKEARAECAPAKMVRATIRNATPDLDPNSYDAQPKTYYRLGTRYGRLEEALNKEHGLHPLTLVNEPDMWMVNLLNKKGRHKLDKEAPQHFHVPILWVPGGPEFLKGFELGCELEYVKAKSGAAPPKPEQLDGHTYDAYTATSGEHKIVLLVDPATGKPFSATSLQSGRVLIHVRYVDYAVGLEPDLSLFVPPKDVRFLESK